MKAELIQRLRDCRTRVTALQGMTAHPGNMAGLESAFQAALEAGEQDTESAQKLMRDLLNRSRGGKDMDATTELAELRMEKIDLYIRANSNFSTMMFEEVTLKDNEQAVVETSYRNPVNTRYIGQDGGVRTVKAVKARQQTFIDMRELTSDSVGYQMRDIQLGPDIEAQSQATVDIGWDLNNREDVEAFNLLYGGSIGGINYGTSIYGAFKSTGAPLSQTFLPHVRIDTRNLPTTNDYKNSDLDDAGTSTDTGFFRLSVIRKIMDYCAAWGNVFGDRPLRPTGAIFLPSSEALKIALGITPIGIVNNPIAEGILRNYSRFSFMDIDWTLIPDVTLPPGTCYPILNRPVGRKLRKPSMDQEFVDSQPRKNWEERAAARVVTWYTQEPWRPFALRVAYNNSPKTLKSNTNSPGANF